MFFFQAGTLIDNELNVKPGTPLNMEVTFQITAHSQGASQYCLDSESSSVYGLMVTGMEVTNTWDQSKPILVNG